MEIQKNDGMWTLKREIISPKFDELLIKTEIKGYIAIDLRKFYNHVNICINEVTRIREDLLPDYQSIKRHSDFEEYFVPDCDHPAHSWNAHTYTYLGNPMLTELTNDKCVKSSMAPQAYKVVNTNAHKISGWKIIYILIHAHYPHIGGMNGDVKSDLSTLELKNGEQHEMFCSIIIRLQQEINLYGETVSPTRLPFRYTKEYHQRAINSKHSLRPRLQISLHSLTTTENWLSSQEEIFMESILV